MDESLMNHPQFLQWMLRMLKTLSGMREGSWDHLGGHRTALATEVSCDGNILGEADIPGATP